MLNNINLIDLVGFPYLYDKDEDSIIKKLVILNFLQKKNLKYFKVSNPTNKNKNYFIYLFNDCKKDILLEILFYDYILKKDNKVQNYYLKTKVKYLSTTFMINKLYYNKSDNTILISIFYTEYLALIKDEIFNKYKKKLIDFKNYNDLYIFLKKYGYVDKYYNYYAHKMIKNYDRYYKKLIGHLELKEFKVTYEKNFKNFKDIDLIKIIDKYVNNKFNKKYIKNKFIELTKKYNI